jgi:NAD(P)-dependent dehydrogenase (short-subunit alcohol dehydrogenase family)/pimeloyl-ACP methyl ester carboxylesterase
LFVFDGAVNRTVSGAGVELSLVEAGDPSRPTIVFVHGYPDTKEVWSEVLELLAPRFHVAAYDVRGAGASSAPRGPKAYDYDRLADDLQAVIDAVAPGGRVHLVGHDWGGVAGWEFATTSRFAGRLASFTTISGPSVDQLGAELHELVRRGRLLELLRRGRRSWYVSVLITPGGPTLWWRRMFAGERWKTYLRSVDHTPVVPGYPAETVAADGLHGANLYRRNIPRRMLRPRADAVSHVPVQLIVPSGDRYISERYYDRVPDAAPQLRRRRVAGSHWAQRTHPDLIARWVGEFAEGVEAGGAIESRPLWSRGGGVAQLRDRLALVTGAGSGIGRATALALGRHGARLLLVDRDSATVAETARELDGACTFTCDVSDEAAMEKLAETVLAEHGVPDVVVNNAGIGIAGSFLDTSFNDWRKIIDVNLMGVVHGCRLFGQAMVERGEGGHIVNISSGAAFAPNTSLPAYSTTKAGVLMLSECLRAELAGSGIGVTAVCPGVVATNITRATEYVGKLAGDQDRLRDLVSGFYERRGFTADMVAAEIVEAIGSDRPIAVVTPESKFAYALSRLAPGVLRRLAQVDTSAL